MMPEYPDREWNGFNNFYNELKAIFLTTYPGLPVRAARRNTTDYIHHVLGAEPKDTFAEEIVRFKKYIKFHHR